MHTATCAHCHVAQNPRRRDFSDQAWTVLVVWQEIGEGTVDRPLCEGCYGELRDILIERASEIEASLAMHFRPDSRRRGSKRAAGARLAG